MRTPLSFIVMLLLVFVATSQASSPCKGGEGDEEKDDGKIWYSPRLAPPHHGYSTDLKGAAKDEQYSIYMQSTQVRAEFTNFIRTSEKDWRYIDSEIRNELAKWKDHKYFYSIAQTVSSHMLWDKLLEIEDVDDDVKEAIGFYTELAVENYCPDSELFGAALPVLKEDGFWNAEKVATVAFKARSYALTFFHIIDQKPNRTKEILEESKSPAECHSAESLKHTKMREALLTLDSLIKL